MICPHCGKETTEAIGGLTKEEVDQANAKVDAMLNAARKFKYPNREKFPEPLMHWADLYFELTKQEPLKTVLLDWLSTFNEWEAARLTEKDIRDAFEYSARPNGGFPVGRPGSLTVTAKGIKSKSQAASPKIDTMELQRTQELIEQRREIEKKSVPMPDSVRAQLGKLKSRMES